MVAAEHDDREYQTTAEVIARTALMFRREGMPQKVPPRVLSCKHREQAPDHYAPQLLQGAISDDALVNPNDEHFCIYR